MAATVTVTDPLSVPLPPVMEIHSDEVVLAVHAQPAPVCTANVVVPPLAGMLADVGDRL